MRQITQGLPACFIGHPKDIFLGVVVAYFQLGGDILFVLFAANIAVVRRVHEVIVGGIGELRAQLALTLLEGIGDVFEKDQAEHYVLVNRGVQSRAQLVSRCPELLFKIVEELLFDGVHLIIP